MTTNYDVAALGDAILARAEAHGIILPKRVVKHLGSTAPPQKQGFYWLNEGNRFIELRGVSRVPLPVNDTNPFINMNPFDGEGWPS